MKILLVNNFHYHRGGAERAYFDLAEILAGRGHELAFFAADHPSTIPSRWKKYFVKYYELSDPGRYSFFMKMKIAIGMVYKNEAKKNLRKLLEEFKPDVAHLHNIFHHLTPSVIDELKRQKIPVVMTLHDFQFVCPNNILFSRGNIWENSKGGKFYKAFLEKSVHDSYAQSFIAMVEMYFHKWRRSIEKVDILISPSNFLIEKAKEFGFSKKIEKVENVVLFQDHKSESASPDESQQEDWLPKGDFVAFVGRLSEEKGVDDLLKAFATVENKNLSLVIMGDGPLKEKLVRLTEKFGITQRVVFLDYDKQKHSIVQKRSIGIVNPSRCYENSPYGILDGFMSGKAVICANHGGQKELVREGENGFLFESGNIIQLAKQIDRLAGNKQEARLMGEKGRIFFKERYSAEIVSRKLEEVYQPLKN